MDVTPIETVCVVGAGYMGAQIALQCAAHGCTVWLAEASDEALQRAAQSQVQEMDRRVEAGHITSHDKEAILRRLTRTAEVPRGVADADLVIEAVPENLQIKREVFHYLDAICPAGAILATNSSSIPISAIEDVTQRRDRVLNAHFFAPVWQRTMVELMRGAATSDETIDRMYRFVQRIGMTPLVVQKESRGFILNRIWRAVKKEALHVVDDGVAPHEDVDRAWMIMFGTPMGPFGLMDMIGLDVVRDIENIYYQASGDPADAPPPLLLDKITRGELGVKTGRGFYTYPNPAYQRPGWLTKE